MCDCVIAMLVASVVCLVSDVSAMGNGWVWTGCLWLYAMLLGADAWLGRGWSTDLICACIVVYWLGL